MANNREEWLPSLLETFITLNAKHFMFCESVLLDTCAEWDGACSRQRLYLQSLLPTHNTWMRCGLWLTCFVSVYEQASPGLNPSLCQHKHMHVLSILTWCDFFAVQNLQLKHFAKQPDESMRQLWPYHPCFRVYLDSNTNLMNAGMGPIFIQCGILQGGQPWEAIHIAPGGWLYQTIYVHLQACRSPLKKQRRMYVTCPDFW